VKAKRYLSASIALRTLSRSPYKFVLWFESENLYKWGKNTKISPNCSRSKSNLAL